VSSLRQAQGRLQKDVKQDKSLPGKGEVDHPVSFAPRLDAQFPQLALQVLNIGQTKLQAELLQQPNGVVNASTVVGWYLLNIVGQTFQSAAWTG